MSALSGMPVLFAPNLRDGSVLVGLDPARPAAGSVIRIGTRPLTDVEFAGLEGRYIVRRGMADVLEWCGQEVGPPPSRTGNGQRLWDALVAHSTPARPAWLGGVR